MAMLDDPKYEILRIRFDPPLQLGEAAAISEGIAKLIHNHRELPQTNYMFWEESNEPTGQ